MLESDEEGKGRFLIRDDYVAQLYVCTCAKTFFLFFFYGVDQGCRNRKDFKFDLYRKQAKPTEGFNARRSFQRKATVIE